MNVPCMSGCSVHWKLYVPRGAVNVMLRVQGPEQVSVCGTPAMDTPKSCGTKLSLFWNVTVTLEPAGTVIERVLNKSACALMLRETGPAAGGGFGGARLAGGFAARGGAGAGGTGVGGVGVGGSGVAVGSGVGWGVAVGSGVGSGVAVGSAVAVAGVSGVSLASGAEEALSPPQAVTRTTNAAIKKGNRRVTE
jgi:hypothetical protein